MTKQKDKEVERLLDANVKLSNKINLLKHDNQAYKNLVEKYNELVFDIYKELKDIRIESKSVRLDNIERIESFCKDTKITLLDNE